MQKRQSLLVGIILGLSAMTSSVAMAGPATEAVKDLEEGQDRTFEAVWDFDLMAQAALGSEWTHRSSAERAQFSALLKQLVLQANRKAGARPAGQRTEYLGEEAVSAGVKVRTRVLSPDKYDDPVEIDYRLAAVNGKWRVFDRITDGVSMTAAYRSQFVKIIKAEGFAALLEKMRRKISATKAQ